jgi:hypothetical protein
VRLARRGLRNMDSKPEGITQADELAAVRRQARKVYVQSVVSAVVLTAVCVALPF